MVEPVDPFKGSELHRLKGPPRPASVDDLSLVEAVDRLGERIVIAVADAADRGLDACLGQALDALLDADELPSLAAMMHRFTPATTAAPAVAVILPPVTAYDRLLAPAADRVPA